LPPASRPTDDPAAGLAVFADLQAKIKAARDGARIVLPPGRYPGGANFDGKSGITVEAQMPGTVFLEGGQARGGEKITLKGLVIQKVVTPLQVGAVETGPDWVMEDCTVQDNESLGVSCSGPRTVLRRVRSIRNGYMGFGCGSADGKPFPGPKLYDCESAWNNTGLENPGWKFQDQALFRNGLYYANPSWEGGGGKFCLADGLVIERMKSHDNGGPGIWLDVYDLAATIRDCESFNNFGIDAGWQGPGFAVEICAGPTLIENCYAHDNMGSAFAIWESRNVTIRNCIASGTGIEFRDLDGDRRNSGWFCRNVLLDSVRFFGSDAQVYYWKNQSSSWRKDYQIVERELQLGLREQPQWTVK
jgi:parallel beta-helix repeat protein